MGFKILWRGWVVIAALAAAGASTLILRDAFLQMLIVAVLIGYVALPSLLNSALSNLLKKKWRSAVMGKITIISFWVAMACILQVLSLPGAGILHKWDVLQAQQFCERLTVRIDAYLEKEGRVPYSIDEVLPSKTKRPYLLREQDFYSGRGDSFRFTFYHSGGLFNGYEFDTNDRL